MFSAGSPGGRTVLATAIALALLTAQGGAQQGKSSPFESLAGAWTGEGTVTLANGTEERIRCRARYSVEAGGSELRQQLRCASASYNFDLSSDVSYQSGTISGQWTEATRNTGGRVSGSVLGPGQVDAVVEGAGFSANLRVMTRGSRQSVQVTSRGQQVNQVSITLNRS